MGCARQTGVGHDDGHLVALLRLQLELHRRAVPLVAEAALAVGAQHESLGARAIERDAERLHQLDVRTFCPPTPAGGFERCDDIRGAAGDDLRDGNLVRAITALIERADATRPLVGDRDAGSADCL